MSGIALVAGASGLIGRQLVRLLLDSGRYAEVKALVRKPLGIDHARLSEIRYDFHHPDPSLIRADVVFCCLGTTIKKAGSREAFREVDEIFSLQVAEAGLANGASRFHIVTAMGADSRSFFLYNRVKGDVEEGLKRLGYPVLHIYRPSLLLGAREERRIGEKIAAGVMGLLQPLLSGPLLKYRAIEASRVARAMLALSASPQQGVFIHSSADLQRY